MTDPSQVGRPPEPAAAAAPETPAKPAVPAAPAVPAVPAVPAAAALSAHPAPASRGAGGRTSTALQAQIRAEVVMTLRRGESLLLTLGIPIVLLGFFALIGYPDKSLTGGISTVDFLAPGIIALAVMSTAMVSLGIATGFERQYGVLKRLGSTPLGRGRLLAAKTVSIAVVEALQIVVLGVAAWLMGWTARGDVVTVLAVIVLATIGFAGVGLLMAGTLRAEMTLAAANGLYLILLLLGGMVVPLGKLPGAIQGLARALPAAELADALHSVLGHGGPVPNRAWLVLGIWAIGAPLVAARLFRWE